METLKQFTITLEKKIKNAIERGDVFHANEIEANLLLGAVLIMMIIISIICLVLNELGIFTADKTIMRYTIVAAVIVQTPIMLLNQKYHGEPKWMKGLLEWGLLAVCGLLYSTLGHNATLVFVIPIILSIRYCDKKFTRTIAVATIFIFLLATLGNAYFGILNLNMYKLGSGTTLTITESLRQSVIDSGIDNKAYFKSLVVNDFIPKLLVYSIIGFSSIKIAERGRNMTELQDEVTSKASRIETELNLATEIQAGMLPCIFPAFPDHGELELFASNTPAKEVGGDFYDYFKIDDNHIAIVMADVSGKGVGAALFMTISKILIKNQLMVSKSPALALTESNRQLCENNEAGLFVTTWAGVYDISTGILTYTNAGHNPPLIHHKDGECEYLKGINGLVLAGMEGIHYSESQVSLKKGDEIFLYTDGVTEATSIHQELYGEERLIECFKDHLENTVKDQVTAVLDDINVFIEGAEQFDDITMLGMKVQ